MKHFLKENAVLFLFSISVLTIVFLLFYTRSLMTETTNLLLNSTKQNLIFLSHSASTIATPEELENIHDITDTDKPIYNNIKIRLAKFCKQWDLVYAYYMRLTEDGSLQYIADNIISPDRIDEMDGPDSFIYPGELLYDAPRKAFDGEITTTGIYVPDIDGLMAAYTPMYDKNGKVYCVAGVDIRDAQFINLKNKMPFINSMQLITLIIATVSGFIGVILHRRKADLAMQASIAKSNFLANMSHEIRTPINAIIGMTTIAKDSDDIIKKDYCLEKIDDASSHLLGIINDILDMSKIEANKFSLSPVEFDFKKMAEQAVNIIFFRANEKHQQLTINVGSSIPSKLIGDDQRIKQVITNLMSNAVKFTPENGLIKLNAVLLNEENDICTIQTTISDTGIGISEEQKEHLFHSFQQGDNSISRKFGGTGLGLAISKRIVEMMNGDIWISSNAQKGTDISFTVQLTKAKNMPQISSDVSSMPSFKGKRMLLVDDVEINREIVKAFLESTQIEIDSAVNGKEAVEIVSSNPDKYDIIFMDIQMPEMDGYQATQKIRALDNEKAKNIPIVAMTANAYKEDIEKSIQNGMNDHIAKPLGINIVLNVIKKYL